ncbi:hypothetical protein [Candidatus Albibeggiatoa sp. nov. BB20]|uniref:hypothetical protein n=1 Tax=Candidatus Albibeggiatoa sp. nov. BB20 TaxID=3162723 RepID=UPI003365901C
MEEEKEVRTSIMSKFVSAGLEIKKLYSGFTPSISVDAWLDDEVLSKYAKTELGMYQNRLQLLSFKDEANINKLGSFILQRSDVVLISLDILKTSLDAIYLSEEVHFPEGWEWKVLGLDICDINGLYSYLEMTSVNGEFTLFKEEQLLDALALCEKANIIEYSHSPFVVARLRRLISI